MKKIIISITVSLTISVSIFAQSSIRSANTFKCKWDEGYFFSYIKGSSDKGSEKWGDETIIDNINLQNNTARIIGNAGSNDLAVFSMGIGLVFMEQTLSAFHTLVIHNQPTEEDSNVFPTFYHRHASVMSSINNSNFYGYCKIWN